MRCWSFNGFKNHIEQRNGESFLKFSWRKYPFWHMNISCINGVLLSCKRKIYARSSRKLPLPSFSYHRIVLSFWEADARSLNPSPFKSMAKTDRAPSAPSYTVCVVKTPWHAHRSRFMPSVSYYITRVVKTPSSHSNKHSMRQKNHVWSQKLVLNQSHSSLKVTCSHGYFPS